MYSTESPIQSERLTRAMNLIGEKNMDAAQAELLQGIEEANQSKNLVLEALFYSTLGMLCRLKSDFKTAWRHYEKAEKLLPDDPSLKLISARLLIEVFSQCDTAIRKAEKALKLADKNFPIQHHAYTTLGLAYLKKGNRKKTLECLSNAVGNHFAGLISAANIDFRLLEALVLKKAGLPECRQYLEEALNFSLDTKESVQSQKIEKLLKHF